jgi:signal transduction histidine kinase
MVGDPANLGREFRTLVMALRDPLEAELADRTAPPTARRDRLAAVHRHAMRLLDFMSTFFDLHGHTSGEPPAIARAIVAPVVRDRSTDRNRDAAALRRDPRSPADGRGPAWAAELERTNQELEAFSYSVAHDLQGPLRAIAGFSEVLLTSHARALDRPAQELLQAIHGNASRMAAIVHDLLALSQVGSAALRRELVDLTAIARRVVADLRLREPSRAIEIAVTDGIAARCDGRLVTIALENLFANAWKFTRTRAPARITFDRESGGVFALRDNGVGFDMERADRLFEPFQRLHDASEFEGTGIGLAIVRRVIERHAGLVWAHGIVDRGATVRFTLEPEAT